VRLADRLRCSPLTSFAGLLTHCGHTYQASGAVEVMEIHRDTMLRLSKVKATLADHHPGCLLSIGDTPSCSILKRFHGVDEIRPGNFVFYDLMQFHLGACSAEDIAIAVACPVVGKYHERREVVVYGGAVHLSKESLRDERGRKIFGALVSPEDCSLGQINLEAPVVALSQEHGILQVGQNLLREIEPGDLLHIAPVHSCLTCNLHRGYVTLEGRSISRR